MPVKIDADKNKPLLRKYGIRGLPTILFVDSQGEVIKGIVGYRPPEKLVPEMESVFETMASRARSAVRKAGDDGEAHARLGLAYALAGRTTKAEEALGKARVNNYRGPAVGQAYNALGDYWTEKKEWDKAIAAYTAASRVGRKQVAVLAHAKCGLARAYHSTGEAAKARRTAKAVLRLKDLPRRYAELARKYAQ